MSKHTPGPWQVVSGGISVDGADGSLICSMTEYKKPTPRQQANARLIAAAPELLEAVKAIAECCDEDYHVRGDSSRLVEIRGIARLALRKAEGEQQ